MIGVVVGGIWCWVLVLCCASHKSKLVMGTFSLRLAGSGSAHTVVSQFSLR